MGGEGGGSDFQGGHSRPASCKHPRPPGCHCSARAFFLSDGARCGELERGGGEVPSVPSQPRNGPSGILPVSPGVRALSFLQPLPLPAETGRCTLPSFLLLSLPSVLFRKIPALCRLGSRGGACRDPSTVPWPFASTLVSSLSVPCKLRRARPSLLISGRPRWGGA